MTETSFRLSKVLRLRIGMRDQRRLDLAEALLAEEILGDRRRELDSRRADLLEATRSAAGPGTVDLERIMQAQRYEAVLLSESAQLSKQRLMLQEEITRRRQALVDADRQVRALEILHKRHQEKQRKAAEKTEQMQLDEFATWTAAVRQPEMGIGI